MHILMVASENDALPGGKVGGLGDVIRDLPAALAQVGHTTTVITPDYGRYVAENPSQLLTEFGVTFCGHSEIVRLHIVTAAGPVHGVQHLVVEHPLFRAAGIGRIYVDDDAGPFATDAHRFALFSLAVAELLRNGSLEPVDVLHCHDWHSALLLLIRKFVPGYEALRQIPAVYSIHNLSLQGVRPLRGVQSSLQSWFPGLNVELDAIKDPAHDDCINLMRTGINLADRVHTVSPTYAREILQPSDWDQGIVGGEGLEQDLRRIDGEGRMVGILNGCEYGRKKRRVGQARLTGMIEAALDNWVASSSGDARTHYHALRRLQSFARSKGMARPCLVSIGRLTMQKMYLLIQDIGGEPTIDWLLERLDPGLLIMLGSGDAAYEKFFREAMERHSNFVFLNGYSQSLSDALYGFGDLFLMPSIYEPCGISQMLAMRAGTPCLVHSVGGLADTVQDGIDGFSFGGDSLAEKQRNLLATLERALTMREQEPQHWKKVVQGAAKARFLWSDAARQYIDELYQQS